MLTGWRLEANLGWYPGRYPLHEVQVKSWAAVGYVVPRRRREGLRTDRSQIHDVHDAVQCKFGVNVRVLWV